jgi:hypothetical protein
MNRRRIFHVLFALGMATLGIYVGLLAIQQGADSLGVWCWIVALCVEYGLLICAPDGHAKRKGERQEE